MSSRKRVFQISGLKDAQRKGQLLRAIKQLGGVYIGGPIYTENTTHLIVPRAALSEKFLAACAGGKWIVTPEYILDSMKHNGWMPEARYEVNLPVQSPGSSNPLRTWREKVARREVSGAFQGWVVLLTLTDLTRRDIISRILKAGRAVVYLQRPASVAITHVMSQNMLLDDPADDSTSLDQLALHLLGTAFRALKWSGRPDHERNGYADDMDSSSENVIADTEGVGSTLDIGLLSGLQSKLEDYVGNAEKLKQKKGPVDSGVQSFYLSCPFSQRAPAELWNVGVLLECSFFPTALEELQNSLGPGVIPAPSHMQALMQHALDGTAEPYSLSMFSQTLHNILRCNSPWGSPAYAKYYQKILQCPECKAGVWSLLSTSFRFCMSSTATCHSLPSSPHPDLIRFHCDLQKFILKLFQVELHAMNSGLASGGPWSTVLGSSFWPMWERSTLISKAVQQLLNLLVEAHRWAHSCPEAEAEVVVLVQELLDMVLELWCQAHSLLNRPLVDKSLLELGEHIAILSLAIDMAPDALSGLISGIRCCPLRVATADALFRFICRRHVIATGTEPLSLRKIVSTYVKALGSLCGRRPTTDPSPPRPRAEPTSASCANQKPGSGSKGSMCVDGPGKENIPRGLNRVNAAGETLLHRACKRDQVETLLHILAQPGTDVNVKDHAGWTPLHEACNHGSSLCVRALLEHSPTLQLASQVGGVSPLHDALLNGHVPIAKMLLQYGGSDLLKIHDKFGRTPLDLVPTATLREELRHCASEGDSLTPAANAIQEVQDLGLVEGCSWLLLCLLLGYQEQHNLPDGGGGPAPLHLPPIQAHMLLSHGAGAVTHGWANAKATQLAHDLEVLLGMQRYLEGLAPALRRCQGAHTQLLVQELEGLRTDGEVLLVPSAAD